MSATSHQYSRDVFSAHAESLSQLSGRMTRGSEVLELGPAKGYFTRILKQALKCEVDAIEIDPTMAEHAQPHCRDLVIADLDTLDWAALWPGRRYDTIIAADVLEHLRSPERALIALRQRLKPGGRLLISLPNIAYAGMIFGLLEDDFRYRDEGLLDRTHLRFFTRTTLEETLTANGWQVTWRGEVGKDIYEAEFHTRIEQWPQSLREFVIEHPNRRAYQLLCECAIAAEVPAAQVIAEADHSATAPQFASRLMWGASSAQLCFENGVVAFGTIGAMGQTLRWQTAADARVLRIRLADRPGYFALHSLNVQVPNQPAELITIAACTCSSDMRVDSGHGVLASSESWLQLPEGNFPANTVVTMVCDWPMSGDFTAAAAALKHELQARDALVLQLQTANARSDSFEKKMLEREALIVERDRTLAEREAAATHAQTLIAERERIIVERDVQIARAQTHVSHLDALVSERESIIERIQSDRQALNAECERLNAALQETQAQLQTRYAEIAELKTVKGWLRAAFKRNHT
jgi:O-antigen biosynthesis protein